MDKDGVQDGAYDQGVWLKDYSRGTMEQLRAWAQKLVCQACIWIQLHI